NAGVSCRGAFTSASEFIECAILLGYSLCTQSSASRANRAACAASNPSSAISPPQTINGNNFGDRLHNLEIILPILPPPAISISQPFPRPRLRLGSFLLPILRRSMRLERLQQPRRDFRNLRDCRLKRVLVRLRRLGEAADLADKLQRRRPDLVLR